jgi:hypothetical protein
MRIRLSILVLAIVSSGCATIFDGTSQPVTFNSSPNGARSYVNGMEIGTTPLTMPVKRSKTTMVLAKSNGYEDQQLVLQTKTNVLFWGNILFLYGSTTDFASDAMIEYSPNMYYITLNPIPLLQSNNSGIAADRGARTRIEHESIRTERQVRSYILRNHAYLVTDIFRGQGEYLSSLYDMLQLPASGETLKRFRSITARYKEPLSFAEVVLFQYPVDASAAPPQGQKTNQGRR